MIETPEALTLAHQMDKELKGRRIFECIRGNSPHKFAFYNHEPEEYAALLNKKILGRSYALGGLILTNVEPEQTLVLGGGGELILLHLNENTLPKKHQFLLHFEDGAYLTVSIQMWGCIQVMPEADADHHPFLSNRTLSPLSSEFTLDYFNSLFSTISPDDPRSVKFFLISKPGFPGLGNGYTQDILFRAGLHPRHTAVSLGQSEKRSFYNAIRETLIQAAALGGRDDERDLYGCPGGYHRILSSKTNGQPCPVCGAPIEKINYLGGASYFCPNCQV